MLKAGSFLYVLRSDWVWEFVWTNQNVQKVSRLSCKIEQHSKGLMKDIIEYPDFEKLDLRVGKITAAEVPAWSKKLMQFTVDFGEEIGTKTILSGIQAWYTPADFIGKNFPFVVNLAERKMGEGVSQGMMIMADGKVDGEDHPIVFPLPDTATPGTVIR